MIETEIAVGGSCNAGGEPFNTRMELSDERLHHWLKYFKINPDNEYEPYQCHASGHACGPDLLGFIELIQPKKVVPIHTEKPDLFNTISVTLVIPEKGAPISI